MGIILRLVGLRRIVFLLWWLQYGSSALSFAQLPAEARMLPPLVNGAMFLIAPTVALWLAVFATDADFAWLPSNAMLLVTAIAMDIVLLVYNWRRLIGDTRRASLWIARRVQRDYPPELHDDVLQLLGRHHARWSRSDTLRTRMYLLDLAHGDIDILHRITEVAMPDTSDLHDWRQSRPWPAYL